jgi:hypothetical protein
MPIWLLGLDRIFRHTAFRRCFSVFAENFQIPRRPSFRKTTRLLQTTQASANNTLESFIGGFSATPKIRRRLYSDSGVKSTSALLNVFRTLFLSGLVSRWSNRRVRRFA